MLSDKPINNNNLMQQQRQSATITTPIAVSVGGDNTNIPLTNDLLPKRSNMSSNTYSSSREKDRNKPSKSVNFRPSSLINEREYANENQTELRNQRANYSYDSQANRIPISASNSQSSYYAQAIGIDLFLCFY